jgi:hypothetical protein
MPTSWTDLAPVDPYVGLSSGRSFFRPNDLLALAEMLRRMRQDRVSEIMP